MLNQMIKRRLEEYGWRLDRCEADFPLPQDMDDAWRDHGDAGVTGHFIKHMHDQPVMRLRVRIYGDDVVARGPDGALRMLNDILGEIQKEELTDG